MQFLIWFSINYSLRLALAIAGAWRRDATLPGVGGFLNLPAIAGVIEAESFFVNVSRIRVG